MWRCLPNLPCQQSYKATTRLGITQCIPNRDKTVSHISLTTVQWRNKWSMVSPSILHIQHQLTRIMFRLLKFSVVKIFPKPTVHIKKATLGGWFPNAFPWKPHTIQSILHRQNTRKKGTWKTFELACFQQILSSPCPLISAEYKRSRNLDTDTISQSWVNLMKSISQCTAPSRTLKWFATKVALSREIQYNSGNDTIKGSAPHQTSLQKRILVPSPTSNSINLEKVAHPLLMYFHKLTP